MGIIEWIESFGSPLKFLHFIANYVFDKISSAISSVFHGIIDSISNFFQNIFDNIMNTISANLIDPLRSAAGPFWPVIAVAGAGIAVWIGLWILDNIRDLL